MDISERAARSAQVAAVFDQVADTYDNVGVPWFTPIAAELVRLAAPGAGERVLDVGCGRGAALFPLAEAVGPGGRVTGIDLAPRMIAAVRAEIDRRGWQHVELAVQDASAPALGAARFDLIVSSLVLFFLPEPAAALAAWRPLLVPGGRLALSTFAGRHPVWAQVDALFRPYLPARLLDARTTGAAGPFASDAGVEDLVRGAGFTEVRTVHRTVEVSFTDAGEWHRFTRSHGQRALWDAVPPAAVPLVRQQAAGLLEQARGADGRIRLPQQVRCTLGVSPSGSP